MNTAKKRSKRVKPDVCVKNYPATFAQLPELRPSFETSMKQVRLTAIQIHSNCFCARLLAQAFQD